MQFRRIGRYFVNFDAAAAAASEERGHLHTPILSRSLTVEERAVSCYAALDVE